MIPRYVGLTGFVLLLSSGLCAQQRPLAFGGTSDRAFIAVPMVGTGTWADPKRPAYVKEAGLSVRYHLSDDGKMALAEVSGRSRAQLAAFEKTLKSDTRAQFYAPGRHTLATVVVEFKKLKKDFDPDSFMRPAAAAVGGA